MPTKLKLLIFTFFLLLPVEVFANHNSGVDTDHQTAALFSFIDLRDRETFVQVTNVDSSSQTVHVQIFNVDQNCNENNFFDVYTPNDTHIYNMRDIQTNDGNPSGVILPENAYGFIVVSVINSEGNIQENLTFLIGNFRIIDNAGYEYRTNSAGWEDNRDMENLRSFNFSTNNGVSLSDIVFINANEDDGEWIAGPLDAWWALDVDIFDVNEDPLSCRDVIFSCVDEDNPLLEELLSGPGDDDDDDSSASVAAFEYGINEAIPHSRGGELLCPGNIIEEGWVNLTHENSNNTNDLHGYFVGLNNGNGRGTIDSMWFPYTDAD